MKLFEALRKGDTRALARAISKIENRHPDARELLQQAFPYTGQAAVVGITGAPGSGKSTLVDCLISRIKKAYIGLGIIALDPSSPFSGGALLADRIRMRQQGQDPAVFIRSMASRGHLGGISPASAEVVALLEAAGKDFILVETVGVGQDEVDIVQLAELVVVLVTPDAGDDVQVFKAGIMEIADVFVLNKSDSPGSDAMERRLSGLLATGLKGSPRPSIHRTVATTGEGIENLWADIRSKLQSAPEGERRARQQRRFRWILQNILRETISGKLFRILEAADLENQVGRLFRHETDPYSLAEELLGDTGKDGDG